MTVDPHDPPAERVAVGLMLSGREQLVDVLEHCDVSDFFDPQHRAVAETAARLFQSGAEASPETVSMLLAEGDHATSAAELTALQLAAAGSSSEDAAQRVATAARLRALAYAGREITRMAGSVTVDIDDVVDRAESALWEVSRDRWRESTTPLRTLLGDSLDRLAERYDQATDSTSVTIGTPTGFRDLDERLGGLQPSALYIVGARPGVGKTSLALGIAGHAAIESQLPVLFFSLEMSRDEVTQRLLSSQAKVEATRLRNGRLHDKDWNKLSHAIGRLSDAPLYIDDNPNVTVMEMRAKARRLKSRVGGLSLIVIDYVQLMTGRRTAENRQVEVSEISRSLKILARELEVPVVALSQLSRSLEMRADKRPMLADLRESGSLEQDADVVLFIYRDELYNPDTPDRGVAEIIVAKHRSGPTGTEHLAFLDRYTRFANIALEALPATRASGE